MSRDITHSELVEKTFKNGVDIGIHMQSGPTEEFKLRHELLHAAIGISGEAGELLDAVKKHIFYEQALDVNNVIEELGDLKYYIEAMVQNLGKRNPFHPDAEIHEIIVDHNIDKLRKRYDKLAFSNKAAEERKDKLPGTGPIEITEFAGGGLRITKITNA